MSQVNSSSSLLPMGRPKEGCYLEQWSNCHVDLEQVPQEGRSNCLHAVGGGRKSSRRCCCGDCQHPLPREAPAISMEAPQTIPLPHKSMSHTSPSQDSLSSWAGVSPSMPHGPRCKNPCLTRLVHGASPDRHPAALDLPRCDRQILRFLHGPSWYVARSLYPSWRPPRTPRPSSRAPGTSQNLRPLKSRFIRGRRRLAPGASSACCTSAAEFHCWALRADRRDTSTA